jgi:hypothetical protein
MIVKSVFTFLFLLVLGVQARTQGSVSKIDAMQFFKDDSIIQTTIELDLRRLLTNKMKEGYKFPARFIVNPDGSAEVSEPVVLEVRGNFRKSYCYLPPLKITFKSADAQVLSPLGALKLVNTCNVKQNNYEYLLKEYLVYKIYNLLTEKSLRVRLLHIRFVDSSGKRKPINEFGFLIEDVKAMAERNQCIERKRNVEHTESTDRKQMTRVALFEYMIGNLDWSVPVRHNIKLIVPEQDSNAVVFPVPYDFDYSGLVKTDYSIPPPELNLEDVTVRYYRGFPRTMQELQDVANEFLQQKTAIYKLIKEFEPLSAASRKQMITYLDGFFATLSKPNVMKLEFIENARRN